MTNVHRFLRTAGAFLVIAIMGIGSPVLAGPFPNIQQDVGVCDPNFPSHCVAPDSSGNLPVTGTFSATLGGFAPGGTYATLAVSTSSTRVALPAGTVVLVQNTGANTAYVNLGDGTVVATTSEIAVPSNSWIALTVGANADLAGITSTSTTSLTLSGGAGLATGAGGGSSGGGATDQQVQGDVAAGSTDSGNPVKIGGVFNTTLPTLTDGLRGNLQEGSRGSLNTSLYAANSNNPMAQIITGADGTSNAINALETAAIPYVFNGTTWDRFRSAANGANTTGTGVAAVQPLDQFDDTSPTSCTENQFCNVRQSANRDQYETIRDAAGNERGANVNSSNQLSVSVDGGTALGGTGTTGAAVPSTAAYNGANTGGNLTGEIKCQSSAIYDASTNGSTQLVALSAGKVVYVCGFNIVAGGTANVKLIYGTGTACVTGTTAITPAYQLTAQAGIVDDPGIYQGLNAVASNELCINTSAGVAVQAVVYFTQF